ncbi:MAG: HDIG domain-containing protein [Synergistaceae bacterium]|nr:HDIG domain-containing protein [Synergistaceae bacterium]
MKRKSKVKSVLTLPSELSFWQRIDFRALKQYVMPVSFLLIAGVLIVLAQWAILSRRGDSFAVGEPSPETYRVITHMRYDDQASAKTLRGMVRDSIVEVTVRDVSAKPRLLRRLEAVENADAPESKPYLAYMPEALLKAIARLSNADKTRILASAYQVGSAYIDRLEAEKVYRTNTALMASMLWEEINKQNIPPNDANFIYQILAGLGSLNFRVDEELTELARLAAIREVPVLDRRLEPGDVIVSRGDVVTTQIAFLLRMQGYTEDVFPFAQLGAVLFAVLALPMWLDILKRGAGDRKPTWWCVVFVILTAWIWETTATRFGIYGAGVLPAVTVAFLAVPDYLGFCLSIIAAASGVFVITGQAISAFILLSLMAITASTLGFYLFRNLESRMQVYRRILIITLILTIVRMAMRWLQGPSLMRDSFRLFVPLGEFWQEIGLYFLFELIISHIMTFILQYVEEAIGTLSILTLREISHPSSPLLRDLQRYAPGTYQHSLTIATLIEAVGIELRMDINLLRAGAYYHDIGKLRKPHYFVENQGGGLNLNDDMTPKLSSIAIRSHVKDGLELAWEAGLPKRIRDFIAEHHGTTCTFYFYRKALAEGEKVDRSDFTYPGPKPQSRETALLMIVDSVEAAVRAANIREIGADTKEQTASAIEKIINQVVASKLNEDQFDDVNLTQKDLAVIKKTLISVLTSMYHTRKVKKIENRKS